jgi:hypothetical protein
VCWWFQHVCCPACIMLPNFRKHFHGYRRITAVFTYKSCRLKRQTCCLLVDCLLLFSAVCARRKVACVWRFAFLQPHSQLVLCLMYKWYDAYVHYCSCVACTWVHMNVTQEVIFSGIFNIWQLSAVSVDSETYLNANLPQRLQSL